MKAIERFKTELLCYAVNLRYGEEIGCDDFDIQPNKRNIFISGYPIGHLGSLVIFFKGTVEEFKTFNFKQKPIVISNPPKKEEYEKSGLYIFGIDTESYIKKS